MRRTMLHGKIHRATVTDSDLHYEGSITIDVDLLEAADILPGERVQVADVTNGARFETYTLSGTRGSGIICVNGAAARLVATGDTVIIMSYVQLEDHDARKHVPQVVLVDEHNKIRLSNLHQPGTE